MTTVNRISYANGKVKLSWQPVYAGKGYLVEKRNEETGAWETYKTLKASTSSITFPQQIRKQPIVYVHTEDRNTAMKSEQQLSLL